MTTAEEYAAQWDGAPLPDEPLDPLAGYVRGAEMPHAATEPPRAGNPPLADQLTRGGAFILDAPDHVPALWGDGDVVLWAEGESLILAGPPGVGKTTLVGQVAGARLFGGDVLGMPVKRTSGRVLYLAMDRPKQIARSMRRTLGLRTRADLDDKLVVWQGPPPSDVARNPGILLELARAAGADTVIVDSMKDAAIGLTDDETGAGYNRARQLCLANGVELIELHHLVKRGPNGTKPTALADVYGSAWLTAGAGSVVLLWGEAGDPIVEMIHLKQPAETFGPCKIIHDHAAGTSSIWSGVDLLALVKAAGDSGVTAKAAASAIHETDKPTLSQIEKARRQLDRAVSAGKLSRIDGDKTVPRPTVWHHHAPFTDHHADHHGPKNGEPHHDPITTITPDDVTAGHRPSREPSRASRSRGITFAPPSLKGVHAAPTENEPGICSLDGCLRAVKPGRTKCWSHDQEAQK